MNILPEFDLVERTDNDTRCVVRVTCKVMDWVFNSHFEELFYSDIINHNPSSYRPYIGQLTVTAQLYSLIVLRWS